ncbi:MAG TPA: nuclear transport factor 2 family protein [Candidatus Saccharimonadales bacterium]|nr:nuclear transport factor 2 family protein [Candidatus Saccharimonadales bacterium]
MEDQIKQLQNKFDIAEFHGDKEILQGLIADDFLSIGPKGFVLNKKEWINRHDKFTYLELKTSEIDIRIYDNTAIVRNIQRNKAKYEEHPVEVATRVSQVWVSKDGQWKLVAIQFSPLANERFIAPK